MGGYALAELLGRQCQVPSALSVCGAEPTGVSRIITGAARVAMDRETGVQDWVPKPRISDGVREVVRAPVRAAELALRACTFSTIEAINSHTVHGTLGSGAVFHSPEDEFGFSPLYDAAEEAQRNGIHVGAISGRHNAALFQPEEVVRQILDSLVMSNA